METADFPPIPTLVLPSCRAPPEFCRIPKKIFARSSVIYIRGTGTSSVRLAGKINCHSGRTINEPTIHPTLSLILSLPFLSREANRDIRAVSFGGSFPRAKRRRRISPLHQASSTGAYQTSEGGFVISRLAPLPPPSFHPRAPHRSSAEPIHEPEIKLAARYFFRWSSSQNLSAGEVFSTLP